MPNSTNTAVTHLNFTRVSFSVFYKFINTIIGSFLGHNQSCRSCNRCANSCIILIGVLAFTLMREHSQLYGYHTQGMAISLSISSFHHTGYTAAIGLVNRNKFRALQLFFHELDKAASRGIGTATWSLRDNYRNIAISGISSLFAVTTAACQHNCHSQHGHEYN